MKFLKAPILLLLILTTNPPHLRSEVQVPKALTLPAGEYYIGDLCYVLPNQWDEICKHLYKDNLNPLPQWVKLEGKVPLEMVVVVIGDDGGYRELESGKILPVDSGTIGCIWTKYIDPSLLEEAKRLGLIITLESPTILSYHKKIDTKLNTETSSIHLGSLTIETSEY